MRLVSCLFKSELQKRLNRSHVSQGPEGVQDTRDPQGPWAPRDPRPCESTGPIEVQGPHVLQQPCLWLIAILCEPPPPLQETPHPTPPTPLPCRFLLAAIAITDTRHECKMLRFLSHVRVFAGRPGCRFHLAVTAMLRFSSQVRVFAGRPGWRFHLAATAITGTRHECKMLVF